MAISRCLALALACTGCDLAFGLDGEEPCSLGSFDGAQTTDITEADDFSIDWDQTLAVYTRQGLAFEVALPSATPKPIDLGPYTMLALSLTPEGNALFYTASIEPPVLRGALRAGDAQWQLDAGVPRGSYAGTPSADVFGPRRVLVRMRAADAEVVEYEDDSGRWVPVGEPHVVEGAVAPNLTPNGLTMVYAGVDAEQQPAIFAATRASTADWFGPPTIILRGMHRSPLLFGRCKRLYTVDTGVLRRFDR
jgi:hypothetical protein